MTVCICSDGGVGSGVGHQWAQVSVPSLCAASRSWKRILCSLHLLSLPQQCDCKSRALAVVGLNGCVPAKAPLAMAVGRRGWASPYCSSGTAGCTNSHTLAEQGKQKLAMQINASKVMWGVSMGPEEAAVWGRSRWAGHNHGETLLKFSTVQAQYTSAEATIQGPRASEAALKASVVRLGS